MALHPALLFLGGLVVVVLGAEMLLRGATRIATLLRISPIVIGLTVVSVGTSAPELAVGLTAAHEGKGPLAVGNIAGTNIVNILLILGLSAAIRPLPTRSLSVRLDVPVMIATAVALLVMSVDGVLTRAEGLGLLLAAVVYTVALVQLSRQEAPDTRLAFRDALAAPIRRLGVPNVPIPYSRPLEQAVIPSVTRIVEACCELVAQSFASSYFPVSRYAEHGLALPDRAPEGLRQRLDRLRFGRPVHSG